MRSARKIFGYTILLLLPLLLVLLYFNFYATSGDQWSVQCSFHDITGWLCPGCGGQRAFYHLLHGNFLLALRCNALIIILLPFLLFSYFAIVQLFLIGNKKYMSHLRLQSWHAYTLLIILALFFILRNIPIFPFTILSPQ